MAQPSTAPQYLDDNGDPIDTPSAAPPLNYLDDQGNEIGAMKPASVAEQARQRLAERGLTPADVKAGHGVTPSDYTTMGELQDPSNFPTTGEVLSSVGEHALGAVKSLIPRMPKTVPEALTWNPITGSPVAMLNDARQGAADSYAHDRSRGLPAPIAASRALVGEIVPGGSTLNALTEPLGSIYANRPVRKDENLAAAGGVGDIAGQAAMGAALHQLPSPAAAKPTPVLDTLDANLGNDIGVPAKPPLDTTPHGDIINRTIGPGAANTQRGINVGKAFVDSGVEIDPAEVKKNPRALIVYTNKVIATENLAADQLLKSPEAKQPIADGNILTKDAGAGVALIDAADARAAKAVRRYVDTRIAELSAKNGGDGMLSIADTDTLKRELQNRANYDKIFGNTALTSSGALRNQLLANYARAFDSVGDTLEGYRDLNDRRASLVSFRDNVLHPIVDAKIDGSNVRPSKLGSVVRIGASAVKGNPAGVIQGAVDLATAQGPATNPVRIAQAINQQVRAARAAGTESPTARILANANSSDPPVTPQPSVPPSTAQFAGSSQGEAFPIDRRPGAVASAFQPSGPTSASTPLETPSVRSASRSAAQATKAQSNPGFDPDRLPVKIGGAPPSSPPVSHIDLANTLRGVSSSPGELYPSFTQSTRSSAPGQIGAPSANPTIPPSDEFPRRTGSSIEFPKQGERDENDAMFMRRDGRQFPVPVPPSQLLPPQFQNARNVRYGAPLSGDLGEGVHGLYGRQFEPGPQIKQANTVLIARQDTGEPGTYAHEINHAVYQRDLTPDQKRQFQTAVVTAINAGIKDKTTLATIPKAVIAYANTYPNDHDRAFNEMFAELGAQYMLNPTAFRSTYPSWYGMFKQFYGGREYIQPSRPEVLPPVGSQSPLADILRKSMTPG